MLSEHTIFYMAYFRLAMTHLLEGEFSLVIAKKPLFHIIFT